jgi:hypothetical protein
VAGWLALRWLALRCENNVLVLFLLELEMAFPFVHLRGLEKTHMLAGCVATQHFAWAV